MKRTCLLIKAFSEVMPGGLRDLACRDDVAVIEQVLAVVVGIENGMADHHLNLLQDGRDVHVGS
jgi:hypothetical protein